MKIIKMNLQPGKSVQIDLQLIAQATKMKTSDAKSQLDIRNLSISHPG